jgi:predicted dehydrogenase
MARSLKASDRPRIVVVGAGRMSHDFHLPSLKYLMKTRRCSLVAISDLSQEAAAGACRKFGIPKAYSDFNEMLKVEKPDGVAVYVPIAATKFVVSAILKKGYPVLTEKPPGASVEECRDLIRAARIGKARNMVAFNRRFCPVIVQGKSEALKRGKIKGASALMYRNKRQDEFFVKGTGIHSLDALRFLGGDMESVCVDKRKLSSDTRPSFTALIEYSNGTVGTFAVRPEAGAQLERYEVFSEKAVVLIKAGVGWLLDTPGHCEVYHENKPEKVLDALKPYANFKGDLAIAAAGGFYGENAAFIAALHGEIPFTPTLEQSLQSMEIVEALQQGKSWKRRK